MSNTLLGVIELTLIFGVIFGLGFRELYKLRRDKDDRSS